jgi:hypothetical protein
VGPPIGATINPNTGVLTWTPNEAQGPATYTLRVRATDNGTPPLNDTKAFTVIVNEVNTPPVLGPLADQTVMQGSILTFTAQATDADLPAQRLTYTLDARAPVGATINPTNGVFTWTPATNHAPSTNTVTIRVTDNGAPSLNDTKTVTIIVNEQSGLRMLGLTSPIQGYVSLAWTAEAGRSYRVQWKASITDAIWSDLGEVTASDDIGYFTHAVGLAPQGFYRVQLVR